MSTFDELVARYRNMSYGRLSGNNPSAVRSLLDEYNDRTYAQVLDPSQVTYLGDVPQNQWTYDDQNNLVFGMPGESVQGGLIDDGTTGTTGWPTYDPYTDYGDPGYAGLIPGEGGVGTGLISEPIQRGGSGEGRAMHDALRADAELRAEIEKYGFNIPEEYESELPSWTLWGLLDEAWNNREREARIRDIMRDVKESTSFEQDIADSKYEGASGVKGQGGQPSTEGMMDSPSFSDVATGKFEGGTQTGPDTTGSHANVEGPGPVSKTGGGTGKGPGKNGGFAGKGTGAQGPAGGAMGGGYGNWGGR